MIIETIILLVLLTLLASTIGTIAGFGLSVIMVPILLFFFPLPTVLLFVGILHLFNSIWKIKFFAKGINWKIILPFGGFGVIGSFIGANLVLELPEELIVRILGVALLCYALFLFYRGGLNIPKNYGTLSAGGLFSGFAAGLFGIGGPIRGAVASSYNLKKYTYFATLGVAGLLIDVVRLSSYFSQEIELLPILMLSLVFCIPMSFTGTLWARNIIDKISNHHINKLVALFLFASAIKFIIFP